MRRVWEKEVKRKEKEYKIEGVERGANVREGEEQREEEERGRRGKKASSEGRVALILVDRHFRKSDRERSKEEVFQWWGEWSSWSSCSRSCGGGVRSQDRHCLIQRLSTTQNINSSYCVGSPKQYQLCPHQPCPSPSVSFKQHQCSQFNSKAFGRRYYQWIPLYPADYISISNKPCDLQCTTMSGERQLLVPAHDGTFCRYQIPRSLYRGEMSGCGL
ncbi:ADAMTS-like protein 2 [Dissostichus eleginoides]|uniref:ADAMTS-like protein 2 n=1 Tax=Dissostichus eleginoides TaxID=100907 RepID=A0AAD9EV56_DISEL|nr:ADAMTS-like protein 2 [Dissostichus eleginoides]